MLRDRAILDGTSQDKVGAIFAKAREVELGSVVGVLVQVRSVRVKFAETVVALLTAVRFV